jgi:phosphoribosyl-ATP pyrophosphohydrolase
MKHCYKCKETKERTEFYKDRSKSDGLEGLCKACTKIKNAKWVKENPEKSYAKSLTRDRQHAICYAKWDRELTEFVTQEASDLQRLRKEATGITWHTDHIVPKRGKNVCGLHVWNNLQVIPAAVNIRKGNKWQS